MSIIKPEYRRIKVKKVKSIARANPVAKYARKFNRAVTHIDRKKEVKKRGYPEETNLQ